MQALRVIGVFTEELRIRDMIDLSEGDAIDVSGRRGGGRRRWHHDPGMQQVHKSNWLGHYDV